MSMSKLGARGDVGGVCGFKCMLRDMPHHRTTCENRLVNCTFANFGCRWRGSFRRLSAHASQCRVRPRLCPNGCGAQVSVGPMMKRHLDMCPMGEVACDAPDAEADLAICRPVEYRGRRRRGRAGDGRGTRSWPRSARRGSTHGSLATQDGTLRVCSRHQVPKVSQASFRQVAPVPRAGTVHRRRGCAWRGADALADGVGSTGGGGARFARIARLYLGCRAGRRGEVCAPHAPGNTWNC